MHEVLVNRLGSLSLPRKSVVRLTDRPDMTIDVYRGRKTTIQYNYKGQTRSQSKNQIGFQLRTQTRSRAKNQTRFQTISLTRFPTSRQSRTYKAFETDV